MTIAAPRRHVIVIALDLSDYSPVVLDHALDQAARHEAPDLHIVTVVERESAMDDAKRRLAALVMPELADVSHDDWRIRLHVRTGRVHEEIANLAAEIRADLVVVGRFGQHHPAGRLGSIASRVLDAVACPTLVVGLVDNAPDAIVQCAECVATRAASDGERWFCEAHRAVDRPSLASVLVSSPALTGGGLLW